MFRQGPLPPLIHGVLDYLVAGALIAAPFALDFSSDTATATAVALGLALLLAAASADLPTAVVHSVPRALHALVDYAIALALVAAPFVLDFTGDDRAAPAFVAIGAVQLMQTLATRFLKPKHTPRAAR